MELLLGERTRGSQTHFSDREPFSVGPYSVGNLMPRIYARVLGSTSGFTLIEIMVVIIILGILVGLIVPRFMEKPEKARRVKAQLQIESISTALKEYKLDNGDYPTTEQGLEALVEKPSIGKIPKKYPEKGYLSKIPKDPWENDYIYISPGEHGDFDLISYGADGEEGGEGKNVDVQSWEIE
ncbi:MAG: type II secretion system major pseudopilin GspG [Syntrophobacterales bacterium]|jgi:general secretion pathway protein G